MATLGLVPMPAIESSTGKMSALDFASPDWVSPSRTEADTNIDDILEWLMGLDCEQIKT